MNPENFLRDFLRAPAECSTADGAAFLKRCLLERNQRDLLLAWLAAASRDPFLPNAASMLLHALLDEHPPQALAGAADAVNIVGTGGGRSTFNISTAAAFVAASCQVPVVKTGSQAYSSQCGALDVQARLGVLWNGSVAALAECLQEHHLIFVPQTHYSPQLRRLAAQLAPLPVKVIGRLLNMIGPLLCPYQVGAQVTGVAQGNMLEPYAEFVRNHHREQQNAATRLWIVHANCGMDELCSVSDNRVIALGGAPACSMIDPSALACQVSADTHADTLLLAGAGSVEAAACMIERVLSGQAHPVQSQTVALNAAAAIYLAGKDTTFEAAYARALEAIADGAPARLLARVRNTVQQQQKNKVLLSKNVADSVPQGAAI